MGRKRVAQRDWVRVLEALKALGRDGNPEKSADTPPTLSSSAASPGPELRQVEPNEGALSLMLALPGIHLDDEAVFRRAELAGQFTMLSKRIH